MSFENPLETIGRQYYENVSLKSQISKLIQVNNIMRAALVDISKTQSSYLCGAKCVEALAAVDALEIDN